MMKVKKFIKSIDAYQYRRIGIPKNSKYMRITILSNSYPTNLSIQYFRVPTHCSFINNNHENCRCVGMAPNAMNDMLVKNCKFSKSGQSAANCAFYAENGWDIMQDCTFNNNTFINNPNNDFLTCAGHNFIVDYQNSGKIYICERTRNLVVTNCNNTYINLQRGGSKNIVRHGIYIIYNNSLISGAMSDNLTKNNTSSSSISGIVYNSTLYGITNGSNYLNCSIRISNIFLNYLTSIYIKDSTFTPENSFSDRYKISFNNSHLDSCYFNNCRFYGKSMLANHNGFYSAKFIDCIFWLCKYFLNAFSNHDDLISFTNCIINYTTNSLLYYWPFAYSKGSFSAIKFNNCIISNKDNNLSSLIYAYSKPNGYSQFNNCTLNIPSNIFDGYPSNTSFIEDYLLELSNSPIPINIKIISPTFEINKNLKVKIN